MACLVFSFVNIVPVSNRVSKTTFWTGRTPKFPIAPFSMVLVNPFGGLFFTCGSIASRVADLGLGFHERVTEIGTDY